VKIFILAEREPFEEEDIRRQVNDEGGQVDDNLIKLFTNSVTVVKQKRMLRVWPAAFL